MVEGEVETSKHYRLHYLAFARLKFKHLDSHTFYELAGIDINRHDKFVIDSMRVVDMWMI